MNPFLDAASTYRNAHRVYKDAVNAVVAAKAALENAELNEQDAWLKLNMAGTRLAQQTMEAECETLPSS